MTTFGYTTDDITTGLDGVTPVPGVALYVWAAETGGTPVLNFLSALDGSFGWSEDVDVDGRWISAGMDGPRWWVPANEALASLRDRVDTTETRVSGVEDELPLKLDVAAANSTFEPLSFAEVDADRVRQGKGGVIGTSGRGVVAIRFDHGLDPFRANLLPLLTARNLPFGIGIVTKSVGNPSAPYEPSNTTWAQVKTDIIGNGGEVWSHSQTHSDGTAQWGGTSLYDEIVTARHDIESQGIRCMGWQTPGSPGTYLTGGQVHTPEGLVLEPGRLIRATYGLYETNLDGTVKRALPTQGCRGGNHNTIEQTSLANAKKFVDQAATEVHGVEFMVHPLNVGQAGYMSVSDFGLWLDYVKQKWEDGSIEVVTPSGLAFANPDSGRRLNLMPGGSFDNATVGDNIAPNLPAWTFDNPTWTIKGDGGHSGANYLRVLSTEGTKTSRVSVADSGLGGFQFMFEGWCRSVDAGGATARWTIADRGAVTTTIFNKTLVLPQSTSWTRVRTIFTYPLLSTANGDCTVGIGRTTGGTVDWDDVRVVPV